MYDFDIFVYCELILCLSRKNLTKVYFYLSFLYTIFSIHFTFICYYSLNQLFLSKLRNKNEVIYICTYIYNFLHSCMCVNVCCMSMYPCIHLVPFLFSVKNCSVFLFLSIVDMHIVTLTSGVQHSDSLNLYIILCSLQV